VLAGSPEEAGTPDVVTRHTIAESRATLRVLLAEDNPVNQQVAVAMLSSAATKSTSRATAARRWKRCKDATTTSY